MSAGDDQLFEEVRGKYTRYVNPGLAKLLSFGGFGMETHAEGCYIYDHKGNKYLDFLGGYGVFSLGHRHPKVIEAAERALKGMPLSAKVFFSKPLADLAERLAEITPGNLQYSFICNSGTEAVEGALKTAKAFKGRPKVVGTLGGFHGKTLGSLTATGREQFRKPFYPLIPEFVHVPFNDISAMEKVLDDNTAAVILEPVQGEGGIYVADNHYLQSVQELCRKHGALLILDEVQTGFGRTGKLFAMEHSGVTPDLLTLAKAMGGGVMPVGAFMGTPEVWERAFGENPLIHSSTFGGNPLACSCALAAIEVIVTERLWENARERGTQLLTGLQEVQKQYPDLITTIRGLGLMIGVEFTREGIGELVIAQMVKRGVIAAYTLNNPLVLRMEPPLIISPEQVEEGIHVFADSLKEVRELLTQITE
jgi:putrescine aminotransferase